MPQMVQGLVGQSGGLSSVPSRFVQPAHGSPRRTHSSDQLDAVPVIDMEGMHAPDQELRSRVVAEIAKACEEWGFFQLRRREKARQSMHVFEAQTFQAMDDLRSLLSVIPARTWNQIQVALTLNLFLKKSSRQVWQCSFQALHTAYGAHIRGHGPRP
ncbi:uncharacterized protein [Physcomitrium patens]|uniref:uncharacterized protein isoform X2 n=1 Tax=Physcomitrium patens TaxID=3218 RepID=UPI003CCCF112